MLNNFLCSDFEERGNNLEKFFELLKELDDSFKFIPVTDAKLLSPATSEDPVKTYFDGAEYAFNYLERGTTDKSVFKILIDNLLDAAESADVDFSPFIEELIEKKDSLLSTGGKNFFVTESTLKEFAKLCKLTGDALKEPSVWRDEYLASLIKKRCEEYKKKRKSKTAFTAILATQAGVSRCLSVRSGDYNPIPQTTLQTLFEDIMNRDDWGAVDCHGYIVDHNKSEVYLEFPEIASDLKAEYPNLPTFPFVPGIRIATGSTGLCSLQCQMTWRMVGNEATASIGVPVRQKHCNTYEKEAFTEAVHIYIWDRYGELPAKMSELYNVMIPATSSAIRPLVEDVFKSLSLGKVFMQTDAPKKEEADYVKQLTDNVVYKLIADFTGKPLTAYDVAVEIIDSGMTLEVPDSYKEALYKELYRAPYSVAFDRFKED